jgi:hypothetical protein
VLLVGSGCTQLFGLKKVDPGSDAGGSADAPVQAVIDAPTVNVCFRDDFSSGSISQPLAASQPTGGSTAVTNGGVLISWPANTPGSNYGSVELSTPIDLRGGDATVDVDAYTGDTAEAEISVSLDASHSYLITVNTDTVEFDLYDGSTTSYTILGSTPYTHLPLTIQIAHDLGTNAVTCSVTNVDGTFKVPMMQAFTLQNVIVTFAAGSYGAATTVGNAKFDNFVVRSPYCL